MYNQLDDREFKEDGKGRTKRPEKPKENKRTFCVFQYAQVVSGRNTILYFDVGF
jgi:hypothetical protein